MGSPLTTITCHDGPVTTLAFSADPSVVYSGGTDGTIQRWQWDSQESHSTELIILGGGNVTALSLDDCSRSVMVWDIGDSPTSTLLVSRVEHRCP